MKTKSSKSIESTALVQQCNTSIFCFGISISSLLCSGSFVLPFVGSCSFGFLACLSSLKKGICSFVVKRFLIYFDCQYFSSLPLFTSVMCFTFSVMSESVSNNFPLIGSSLHIDDISSLKPCLKFDFR